MNIFLNNKYTKMYFRIVENAKVRMLLVDEKEKHHVIPKSLGGNNDKENLIELSIREHFICHWLLTKMVSGKNVYKMCKALHKMTQGRKLCSRHYEIARKANVKAMTENNPAKNPEARKKMSESHSGKKLSESHKKSLSENHAKHWLGKTSTQKGYSFYNNGETQKMFPENKQPAGWKKGRLNKPWNYGMRFDK